MNTQGAHPARTWFIAAIALFCLLLPSTAHAIGRVEWKSKTLKESEGGSWKVEVSFFLPSAPDVAHVPVRFSFEPKVYYERTMVDGKDEPIIRKVPLEYKQPLVESVDVGFLDPANGKIQKRTKFSFKVTRAHGFEAGEYHVKIQDSRSGTTWGTPVTLIFEGENEVIDRRSMVFTGEKKKKKGDEEKEGEGKSEGGGAEEGGGSGGEESGGASDEPAPGSEDDWGKGPSEGPEPVKEKPGGCGCRLGAVSETGGLSWLLLAAAGAALARRSRLRSPPCGRTDRRRSAVHL